MTVAITYPVDALVSYHYYREDRDMAPLAATGRLRMIGDSGAFSALTQGSVINIGEYAAWCHRWQPHLCWVASLDVIGDPVASFRNWRYLRERHGLDAIPTLHAGADTKWLDAYASEGVDYVGLGGMAASPGHAQKAFRWAVHLFRYARDRWPGVRFHLWGVTATRFLDNLPAYSADSSGAALAQLYRYARLRLFDPALGRHHNVEIRGGTQVHRLGRLLRTVYGVDPADIRTSHRGNRGLLIQLGVASTQQYAGWLQRRHGQIQPPQWGGTQAGPTGPRLHVVPGSPSDLHEVAGPPTGPRLHVVDRDPAHLAATVQEET